MAITLRPDIERLVQERIEQGEYRSADEVLSAAMEALRTIENAPLDGATLDAIDEAEDQIERGEVVDWAALRKGLVGH